MSDDQVLVEPSDALRPARAASTARLVLPQLIVDAGPVAAYIRTHPGSVPTVKQHLAAIHMLGDWLVVSQVLPVNPAAVVRGPTHVVTKGATPGALAGRGAPAR